MVPAPERLKRRAEFLRVAAKGRKAPVHGLVLQALARDDDGAARLGFTVTKKVGNAVIRNRTRRRLKEAARLLLRESPVAGVDLVLIGREATRGRPFDALIDDIRRALAKTGVVAATRYAMTPAAAVLAGAVRTYQYTLRPFIGANCRYEPSCSHYAIEALRVHGAGRGSLLSARRVLRCNPWMPGGDDPVPPPKSPTPKTPPFDARQARTG